MTVYTLEQQAPTTSLVASTILTGRTIARGFTVSEDVPLTGIWFRSASGSGALPTASCIFDSASPSTPVTGTLNSSPTWSGAAGTGWVKVTYDGTVTLTTGKTYYACVYYAGDGTNKWWSLGSVWPSSLGGGTPFNPAPTNGPLTGLLDNGTTPAIGNDTTNSATTGIAFPNHLIGHNGDFGVDVEVTTSDGPATVDMTVAVTMGFGTAAALGEPVPPLQRWITALEGAAETPAKVLVIGDSISEGMDASAKVLRWQDLLNNQLRTAVGLPAGGQGFLPAWFGVLSPTTWGTSASPVVTTVGGSGVSHATWAGLGLRAQAVGLGCSLTWTVEGTDCEIWYTRDGGTGTFTVTIDGVAKTPVSTSGITQQGTRASYSMGSSGSHTVQVTCTAGSAGVIIEGIYVYDGDLDAGIHFFDHSHSGAQTIAYIGTGANTQTVPEIAPDLVILELTGANDFLLNSYDPSGTTANVKTQIAQLNALPTPPSILLVIPWALNYGTKFQTNAGGWTWADYVSELLTINGTNITVLNYFAEFGEATTSGFWNADGIHPTDAGHAEIASDMLAILGATSFGGTKHQTAHAFIASEAPAVSPLHQPAKAIISVLGSLSQSAGATIKVSVPPPPPSPPVTQEALSLILGNKVLDLRSIDNGIVVTNFDPGFATIRESSSDLVEQDGQFDTTKFLTARVAAITAAAAPTGALSIRDVIDLLAPFCDPQAKPQIVYRTSPQEPLRSMTGVIAQGSAPIENGLSQVQVQWRIIDGVSYGMDDESGTLPSSSSNSPGFTFPVTFPLSFGGDTQDAVPKFLQVSGTYRTWPVIRFYGPITGPVLIWRDPVSGQLLGPQIAFKSSVSILSGDFVEVNTRNKTVLMNADPAANRYSYLDLSQTTWGQMEAGQNLLHYSASDGIADCTVTWTPTYL